MSNNPTSLLLDFDGWKRAVNPAVRVIGYTAALFVLLYIVIIFPAFFLGAQVFSFAGTLVTFLTTFGFVVSFFKVIEEEQNKGRIKLL